MMLNLESKKIKTGSVKDIYEIDDHLQFIYSDRYSIYDWGEMPDHIPSKGKALGIMAFLLFRKLEKEKIPHHCLGQTAGARGISVKKVTVNTPTEYKNDKPSNALVPLEVIFRFGIPLGSSLPDRKKGFNFGDVFDEPLIEFSTKLENRDRYLTDQEACELAGMSENEMNRLKERTREVALILKRIFLSEMKITLWDGKLEWAFDEKMKVSQNRDFFLVDSIGPDELRLTYKELLLSKEFLRQFYKESDWKMEVGKAKKEHQDLWKKHLLDKHILPGHLNSQTLTFASLIYTTLANALAFGEGLPFPFEGPTQISELYELYIREFRQYYQ